MCTIMKPVVRNKNSWSNFGLKAHIINLRSLWSSILRSFLVRNYLKNFCCGLLPFAIFFLLADVGSAHQPRLIDTKTIDIQNPEISQAFYGELKGSPVEFRIKSDNDFRLYVGLLVPDLSEVQKNISAKIDGTETIGLLDGTNFDWTPFYEEYGQDHYFWGPEFCADDSVKGVELKGRMVAAGDYRISVYNPTNEGKFTLVTGDIETFSIREMIKAFFLMPRLKAQFFEYSLAQLALSPYVLGYILIIFAFACVFGFIYRFLLRKFAPKRGHKNIGKPDRMIRICFGLGLFLWAVMTSWSPVLLFFSGFCFFEAIFSWCGFYAAIGRNSCPI